MAFFDDWDWGSILKSAATALPQAVAAGYGAKMVGDANQQASDIAAQNRNTNIAADLEARRRAAGILQPVAAQQAPALEYMRGIMAKSPYELSPQQDIELADRRRLAMEMTPSSLRGSGRVVSAISNDVANRGRAGMIAENQRRQDSAASSLGATGGAATTGMANIEAGAGPAAIAQNTGAAEAMGNAVTGTGTANAQTLGNIASFFANSVKDQERDSRYKDLRKSLGVGGGGAGNVYVMG